MTNKIQILLLSTFFIICAPASYSQLTNNITSSEQLTTPMLSSNDLYLKNNIIGTLNDDRIIGTPGTDVIIGLTRV